MGDDEPKSDFELLLQSRMNRLKPATTTQTLDRRRPEAPRSSPAAAAKSRTTEDMRSSRGPSAGRQPPAAMSFQEELMNRRTTLRGGGASPSATSTSNTRSNSATNGGGKQQHEAAPLPARLPSGKKKVPMPPTVKSGKSEENTSEKPSWVAKKAKVSDLASKLNLNGPTSMANQQESAGSNATNAMPSIQPKPKPTPKSDQADNILQRLNDRAQGGGVTSDWQGGRGGFKGGNAHQQQKQPPAPTPCNYEDPSPQFALRQRNNLTDSDSPPTPRRGPGNGGYLRRKPSFVKEAGQKLEGTQNEVEGTPPPVIPKRMESFNMAAKPPKWSQDGLQRTESQRSAETDSQTGTRVRKKMSGNGSPRLPDKNVAITPAGSSSESDYSGDGRVRRKRQVEMASSKTGNPQHMDQMVTPGLPPGGKAVAKPPPSAAFKKGGMLKPPINSPSSGGGVAAANANAVSKSLKLTDFIKSHTQLLPVHVQVQNDISMFDNSIQLTSNDNLYLQLLKTTEMVELNEEPDLYYIPLNTKIKFGLIYNPVDTDGNVSSYMKLPTAGDVMKLKQLPLILTAMRRADGGLPDKSVSEKEILFVKGIVKGTGASRGRQELHVISINGQEKFLSAQCAGEFTTDPHHMKLQLPKILSHGIELPQYVVIYPDRELRGLLPQSLSNCPVLLNSKVERVSVLVSRGDLRNEMTHTENLLELTEDFNALIKPVKMSAADKSFLKEVTESIHNNFTTYNILNISQLAHGSSSPLQNYFYRSKIPGEFCGTSLLLPASCSGADQGGSDDLGGVSALEILSAAEDSISISSHTSGILGDSQSHSSQGIGNTVDSSTYDAEAEEEKEPDDFYEDISELQDDYLAEKMKIEGFKKQPLPESPSPRVSAAGSGSGGKGFSFFKSSKKESKDKKEKKKKGKKKDEKEKYEETPELPPSVPSPPQSAVGTIKTESDSESYNEVNPIEESYLSDNYEDCSFNTSELPEQPPPLPLSLPPTAAPTSVPPVPPISSSVLPAPPVPMSMPPAPPIPMSMPPAPPIPMSMPHTPPVPTSLPPAPPLPTSMPPPASSNFDFLKKKIMQRPPLADKSVKEVPRKSPVPSDFGLEGDYADADVVTLPEHVIAKKKEMKEQLSGGSIHSLPMEAVPPPPPPNNLALSANSKTAGDASLGSLRDQVAHLNGEVESLKSEVRRLSEILEKIAPGSTAGGGGRKNTVQENLRVLQAMSTNDILAMLDTMNFSKYKASFSKEGINGLLFSNLDDSTLKDSLKVSSKLHRSHLLFIACGKNPVPR